jgi:hypothetical protein
VIRINNEKAVAVLALASGISSLPSRFPRLSPPIAFVACGMVAYFGYATRDYPLQPNDPVAWIAFGCVGACLMLAALGVRRLLGWNEPLEFDQEDKPCRQREKPDILSTEPSWFDECESN